MDVASYRETPAPARAGWRRVIVGVFLGYLWSLIMLGVAALVLTEGVGLIPWSSVDGHTTSPLPGPFQPDGTWALFANAVVAVTVVAVAAALVSWVVSEHVGERVSRPIVLVVLAVTGYAPFLYLDGRFRLSSIAGLLVAAALIRWFAISNGLVVRFIEAAEARLLPSAARIRWLLLVVVVAAWSASAAVAAAYGLTHPLGSGTPVDYSPSNYRLQTIAGEDYYLYHGQPGTRAAYAVDVRNVGFADVTVREIELPANSGFRLADTIIAADPWLPRDPTAAPKGRTIPGRSERFLTLDLRLTTCAAKQVGTINRIRIDYRVLGRNESMFLPLSPAPATRC
jgi:hypothetical protein